MSEIIAGFRPHKANSQSSTSQSQQNLKDQPFYTGLYEEYVGVLLCWEEYVKAVKKDNQDFLEAFYEELEAVIDQMNLPFEEKPAHK